MMATRFEKWRTVGGFCARFLLIGAPTNWNLARFLLVLQRAELDLARGCTGFRRVSKHPQRRVRLRVVCVCVCCLFFRSCSGTSRLTRWGPGAPASATRERF